MLHFLVCLGVWTLVLSLIANKIIQGITEGINHVRKMHQIPCSNCVYFTGDYRLKCPVHPMKALSEDAIACRDFEIKSDYTINNLSACSNCKLSKSN